MAEGSSPAMEPEILSGTVKWFNDAKGYGFIHGQSKTDKDVYVYFKVVEMRGYKNLQGGQRVQYTMEAGPKGLQATWVKPL